MALVKMAFGHARDGSSYVVQRDIDRTPETEWKLPDVRTPLVARLDTLPFDICVQIFSYLSVKDLCSMEQTSTCLRQFVNHRHIWSPVVVDIHQVKPLPFPVDQTHMTCKELKDMAIRACRLHKFFLSPSEPKLIYRSRVGGDNIEARMLPGGRYVTLDDAGHLRLFSMQSGMLDSRLPPPDSTPDSTDHKFSLFHVSISTALLAHYAIHFEENYPEVRQSIVRLYSVTDKLELLLDLVSPNWVVSCCASDRAFAYAWMGSRGQCYVSLYPIHVSSQVSTLPPHGCQIELSGYKLDGINRIVPMAATIAFAGRDYLVFGNKMCICIYRVPQHVTDGMTLSPIWVHIPACPYFSATPDVVVCPPDPADVNRLRLSIYNGGTVQVVDIRLNDDTASSLVRVIPLFRHWTSVPFVHVGSSSSMSASSNTRPFRTTCPFIHFLFSAEINRFSDRLDYQTLEVHGQFVVSGDTNHYYPSALSLDEDSGFLLYKHSCYPDLSIYSILSYGNTV